MRIIMGADVSGNNEKNGYAEYIAIILCTEESMNKNYQKIGLPKIHMRNLNPSLKTHVFQNLQFNNTDFIGLCLNVKKEKIINSIFNDHRIISKMPKHKLKNKLYSYFDHLLFQQISSIIELFPIFRKLARANTVMQCDADMQKAGEHWDMKIERKGKAYEIADALAWCNGHRMAIKCSIERDLAVEIYQEMKREFIK